MLIFSFLFSFFLPFSLSLYLSTHSHLEGGAEYNDLSEEVEGPKIEGGSTYFSAYTYMHM